jgi:hypothetical protein
MDLNMKVTIRMERNTGREPILGVMVLAMWEIGSIIKLTAMAFTHG